MYRIQHAGLQLALGLAALMVFFSIHFMLIERDTNDKCNQQHPNFDCPNPWRLLTLTYFWILKFKLSGQQVMIKITNSEYRETCS